MEKLNQATSKTQWQESHDKNSEEKEEEDEDCCFIWIYDTLFPSLHKEAVHQHDNTLTGSNTYSAKNS